MNAIVHDGVDNVFVDDMDLKRKTSFVMRNEA